MGIWACAEMLTGWQGRVLVAMEGCSSRRAQVCGPSPASSHSRPPAEFQHSLAASPRAGSFRPAPASLVSRYSISSWDSGLRPVSNRQKGPAVLTDDRLPLGLRRFNSREGQHRLTGYS